MAGLTLDTGALIALERRNQRMQDIVAGAREGKDPITAPAAAVAEWWRGPSASRRVMRKMFDVEPLDEDLANLAGEALASLKRGTKHTALLTIDAIVMASASRRGDVVYSSDVDDLSLFAAFFPNVRIFSVSGALRSRR